MNNNNNNYVKKIAVLSLLLALAIMMGYVEALIPVSVGIPGIKLGLANLITLIILYIYDFKSGIIVGIMRVIIIGFLFTNMSMLIYSLTGFLFSFIVMGILKKTNVFSIAGVSISGGVMHNIAQCGVAVFCMGINYSKAILYYVPVLLLSGVITGFAIGAVAPVFINIYNRHFR